MSRKEWDDPSRLPVLVPRANDDWEIARLADAAVGYVDAHGHLPTRAAMHPATSAELDLFSRFDWSEILPGASGECHCIEDPDHPRDTVTLYS